MISFAKRDSKVEKVLQGLEEYLAENEATRQQIASTPGCQCVTMPVGYGTKDMEVQVYTYKCDLHRS